MDDEKPLTHRLAVILTTTSVAVSACIGLTMVLFSVETRPLPRIGALAFALTAVVAETILLFHATDAIADRKSDSD